MIVYDKLWKIMTEKGITTYTLRVKNKVSNATVQRLKKNMHVSTYTLNNLCRILDCSLYDIIEYIPDPK